MLLRETRGVIVSSKRAIVSTEAVERFRARPHRLLPKSKPQVIYSSIDPSGGGAGSDYVIVDQILVDGAPTVSRYSHTMRHAKPAHVASCSAA